jgi:hypothetical protein
MDGADGNTIAKRSSQPTTSFKKQNASTRPTPDGGYELTMNQSASGVVSSMSRISKGILLKYCMILFVAEKTRGTLIVPELADLRGKQLANATSAKVITTATCRVRECITHHNICTVLNLRVVCVELPVYNGVAFQAYQFSLTTFRRLLGVENENRNLQDVRNIAP